jgi:hypothetical protein
MPKAAAGTPIQPTQRSQARLAASDPQPIPAASPISPRDDAVARLEGALAEQDRQRCQYEAVSETSLELDAYVRLCEASERGEASERVVKRARWLEWIDHHWDRGRSTAPARDSR